MWPWDPHRREAIGEPPPDLEVSPAQVVQGDEVQIGVTGPPGGEVWVEFELVPVAAGVTAPPAPVEPGPMPVPPSPPTPVPFPGNPPTPRQTPIVRAPLVSSSSASVLQIPDLADQIASVIAYAIVFYFMVAGAMAANFKWGWLVTIAMGAIVWYLRDVIVAPLQGLVRAVLLVVFHVLIEIVEFVWQWLKGVATLFGGDLVRAILQVLMVGAFMWVWEQATQIPVIGQLFTWIEETASSIFTWVQANVANLAQWFDGIRRSLEGDIADLTKGLGDLGDQLRDLLDQQINGLFVRIQRNVTGLRGEILGQLSYVVAAVNLQTGIFAEALHLSPEVARQYLGAYARHHPQETVAQAAGVWASTAEGALGSGDFGGTPWGAVDELRADLAGIRRGVQHDAHTWTLELIDDLRTLHRGDTPDVPPFAQDVIDRLLTPAADPGPLPDLPAVDAPDIPPVEAVG